MASKSFNYVEATSADINLNIVKKRAEKILLHGLDKVYYEAKSKFDIVIDHELFAALYTLANVTTLHNHGVAKIFRLESGVSALPSTSPRVYIVRPTAFNIKCICTHINSEAKKQEHCAFYKIFVVPEKTAICLRILEAEGLLELVSVEDLRLTLFVIDDDLVSVELRSFFRSYYLDGDQSFMRIIVEAIMEFMNIFGVFPVWRLFGNASQVVAELLMLIHRDKIVPEKTVRVAPNTGGFNSICIFDRSIDFMSLMCFQKTFHGLLDDTYGLKEGVHYMVPDKENADKIINIDIRENEFFREVQDLYFVDIKRAVISKKDEFLKMHSETSYQVKTLKGSNVQEMKEMVQMKLKPTLKIQNNLDSVIGVGSTLLAKKSAENFMDVMDIEEDIVGQNELSKMTSRILDMIYKQFSPNIVLRLLCLMSLVCGGIYQDTYYQIYKSFLHSYGYEHLLTWYNLQEVGLLIKRKTKNISSYFTRASQTLSLIPLNNVNLESPSCMSYIFGGLFKPIIPCTISMIDHNSAELTQGSELFPFQVRNKILDNYIFSPQPQTDSTSGNLPFVLICIIGGITFAEMAALRLSCKNKCRFVVLTTSIITGNNVIESLVEPTDAVDKS